MNCMGEATFVDDAGTEKGKFEATYDSHGFAHSAHPHSAINLESTALYHSSDSIDDNESLIFESNRRAVAYLLNMGLNQNDIKDIEKACM